MVLMRDMLDRPLRELIPILQSRFTGPTHYMGILTQRVPFDHWIYQEIIHETDPDFIVEVGVYLGGHMLMLAHLCDARGKGHVIGIDPAADRVDLRAKNHPRATFLEGAGIDLAPRVAEIVGGARVLVIEDSSHTYANTLGVLNAYAPICKPGDYLICEDTICHHGLAIDPSIDPYRAVDTFLAAHPEFERDESRESFVITWNPGGFLRRK